MMNKCEYYNQIVIMIKIKNQFLAFSKLIYPDHLLWNPNHWNRSHF